MHFLFPGMLIGGLAISAPILIHLFNRFRYKQVEWGAMELLRKAVIVRKRKIRIEDLLLLTLRCLAILLLALALARPILTPEGAPWLGKNKDVSVVIALDVSFSMAHKSGVKARFERAADRVRDIAKTLKPGNPVTLMLCGDRPRFLLHNEPYNADTFETKLSNIVPLPERLNVDVCLDEIASGKFLDEIKLKAPIVEFYLVSDAQANSWSALSAKARESIQQLAGAGRVFFLPVAAEHAENLAIVDLSLKTSLNVKGVTVDVKVANFGSRERSAQVKLLVDNIQVDEELVKLAGGKDQVATMYAEIKTAGLHRLTARLEADELEIDNDRHAVVDVPDKLRILVVRPPSAGIDPKEDKDFISKALQPLVSDSFVLDTVPTLDDVDKLANYRLIILSNVEDLTGDQVRNLYGFIKNGGGLMVFLGDNTQSDVALELFNRRFEFDGVPILPARLLNAVNVAGDGLPVEAVEHPLSKLVGRQKFMKDARVYSYVKMKLHAGSREAMRILGSGDAILAEHSLGQGKVVLFSSAADKKWTNMVIVPVIPILIPEAVAFITRSDWSFKVSDDLVVPLPVADRVKVSFKSLAKGNSVTRDSESSRDGMVFARLPAVDQPGFYEIRIDNSSSSLMAAVNVDTRESDVQVLSADALATVLEGLPIRVLPEGETVETTVLESRVGRELRKDVLIALLAILVVEGLLARWITMRKKPMEH